MPTVTVRRHGKQHREIDLPALWRLFQQAVHPAGDDGGAPLDVLVAIERQQGWPQHARGRVQGSTSTFRTGMNFGVMLAFAVAAGAPYVVITPSVWKRRLQLLGANTVAARLRAGELLPQLGPLRPRDEGIAEAGLIGLVAAQLHAGAQRAAATPRSTALASSPQ